MSKFLNVSLRQSAVFIPVTAILREEKTLTETTALLIANLGKLGYTVSEPLLHTLNGTSPTFQSKLLNIFREVTGVNKNWTPLVKGWDVPTGEGRIDHLITFFANIFNAKGTRLQCGHIIPENTFPLERYNGCPFCGTPFVTGEIEVMGQGSKKKLLSLWTEKELNGFYKDLLESKTALDATQMDSLKILLNELPLPEATVGMKETLMAVIDTYVEAGAPEKAQSLFTSPADILRYLWYKHTGFLQIVEPKTIIKRATANNKHLFKPLDNSGKAKIQKLSDLKLKYNRKMCLTVARWLNELPLDAEKACEIMHPKRGMWVRFIRALRLAEYSKKKGFENLARLMEVFYHQQYPVWSGQVNQFRLKSDADNTFRLLKQRPGLFARSLFANMLWFGADETANAFAEIVDKVPARLVFTLNMYANTYFDKNGSRTVKPLGGVAKNIPNNPLLSLFEQEDLEKMKEKVEELCVMAIKKRFAGVENSNKTIFIEEGLFKIPVSIGDRSENVQDLPSALMGTRFPVLGHTIRLFMQWGTGLPAQHMDMDLSCHIAYESTVDICSFSRLVTTGCKHSGDIRSIPEKVGTAEYIDLNLHELRNAGPGNKGAKYVTFTCNAYSTGSITPNMVIGWMDSAFPMKISGKTGVAYDPSCVQHQVRITQPLTKGLVFGVLDIEANEILWLEMPFYGQVVQQLDNKGVNDLMKKLNSKLSVGNLLKIKAEAQGLSLTENVEEADEVYDMKWAMNSAAVTRLLID
ncbi:MAG: hypothetical protein K1X92_12340 [Bacteroidia bacterium]|nr:hypothetical protein [Bacteroidia bacterium]